MIKLIWGIIFLCGGLVMMTIGGYMAKDGWDELKKLKSKTTSILSEMLKPQEEKLLSIIYKYQKELGLNKLIISRSDGTLFFDDENKRNKYNINITKEIFDITNNPQNYSRELESLILDIPYKYLKQIPETRWDNSYVVAITEEGIAMSKKTITNKEEKPKQILIDMLLLVVNNNPSPYDFLERNITRIGHNINDFKIMLDYLYHENMIRHKDTDGVKQCSITSRGNEYLRKYMNTQEYKASKINDILNK